MDNVVKSMRARCGAGTRWVTCQGFVFAAVVAMLLVAQPARARADLVYTITDSGNGISATVDFQYAVDNHGNVTGLEITVTNNSTSNDSAHSVSGIVVTVNSAAVGTPSSLTRLSGDQVTFTKGQGNNYTSTDLGFQDFNPASNDPNLHWFLNTNGSGFSLDNVGYPHIQEMIIPGTSVGSNVTPFNPYFNQTANFYVADSTLPAVLSTLNITGVTLKFGTGPEYTTDGPGSGTTPRPLLPTPEPATTTMAAFGVGSIALFWAIRRRWAKVRTAS
jgi:hypothetical protein